MDEGHSPEQGEEHIQEEYVGVIGEFSKKSPTIPVESVEIEHLGKIESPEGLIITRFY